MRLVLPAGKSLPLRKVQGAITIQRIEGRVGVGATGRSHALSAGQLLFLQADVMRGVSALKDALARVTSVLQR